MHLKRTTIGVAAAGALAAWFAAAMTPGRPLVGSRPIVPAPIDLSGAALANEIARLRARLTPDAVPREPARNPFAFQSARSRGSSIDADEPSAVDPSRVFAGVRLRLSGIAEDPGPDGPQRTAIIAGEGTLFLARPGDTVSDRGVEYSVGTVTADSVELVDREGVTRHLTLQ